LNKEKDSCLHEKTKLKDHIKKYETEFMKSTGRPLAKEDREFHKDDFERYKVSLLLLDFLFVLFILFNIFKTKLFNFLDTKSQIKINRCIN